jgi:hypothetical protein
MSLSPLVGKDVDGSSLGVDVVVVVVVVVETEDSVTNVLTGVTMSLIRGLM